MEKVKSFVKKYTYGWNGGFQWELKAMSLPKWIWCLLWLSALNAAGMWLGLKLDMPFRMDMIGVCYGAYFVGPVGASIVAVLSYLVMSIFGMAEFLYCVPLIMFGTTVAFCIRYLEHNSMSLALIIASISGIVSGMVCVPISKILFQGYTGNNWLDELVDLGRALGFSNSVACMHGELFGNMFGRQLMIAYCWASGQIAYGFLMKRKETNKFIMYGFATFACLAVFASTAVIVSNLDSEVGQHAMDSSDSYKIIVETNLGESIGVTEAEIENVTGQKTFGTIERIRFQLINKLEQLVQERDVRFISKVYESEKYRQVVILAISLMVAAIILPAFWYVLFQRKEKRVAEDRIKTYIDTSIFEDIKNNAKQDQLISLSKKKTIAVFFIDIRGFTRFTEGHETEQVVEVLNKYLGLVTDCIKKNNGTLDKYIGDAVMALFNAPNDVEDYAYHAVKTALDIKERWQLFYKQFDFVKEPIAYGIGIHIGEAIVGNIGCESHLDYTAVGDAVNTASRLESGADPGEILISKELYDLVKDRIDAENIGVMSLRGKKKEVDTYLVRGLINYPT
ncbi:MAG: adenylate/guanylate cyclase domain-containing protein [Lachnospiraceae bacterium]|nr:adenylate/guanylate cyclase domain-containing protein [Lachnospiraceae bacterium]